LSSSSSRPLPPLFLFIVSSQKCWDETMKRKRGGSGREEEEENES